MRDLLHDCAASAPAEQAARIREAHSLLSPVAAKAGLPAVCSETGPAIDALLSLGAHESAVFALMGDECAFMMSRGASGRCLASVVLPDGSEEVVAEGSTLALALLAAYLSVLIADDEIALTAAAGQSAGAAARLN